VDDHFACLAVGKIVCEQDDNEVADNDVTLLVVQVNAEFLVCSFGDIEDCINYVAEITRCYFISISILSPSCSLMVVALTSEKEIHVFVVF
jgi:hypothetical protein